MCWQMVNLLCHSPQIVFMLIHRDSKSRFQPFISFSFSFAHNSCALSLQFLKQWKTCVQDETLKNAIIKKREHPYKKMHLTALNCIASLWKISFSGWCNRTKKHTAIEKSVSNNPTDVTHTILLFFSSLGKTCKLIRNFDKHMINTNQIINWFFWR